MIVLPLIYVAFILSIGAGVVYHLTHHAGMLQVVRGRGAILALIIYLSPLVIGTIAVIFMFKPLFARRANVRRSRSLTPQGEPILFAFVERLASAVGAPNPKRIEVDSDVNASASFRRGWISMLLGGDLTLTIGVPLVAGLTARQFAGVLAHEFGHFRQGAGMRVSYVVRSISFWFTRVVYERDEWDVWLEHVADDMDFRIAWVFLVARGFVWLGRRVLWVLMVVGHAVAGVLLRQMEYDADRQQARLAGSDCFEGTMHRIHELSVANEKSLFDIVSFLKKGALGDNLPKLIMFNATTMPAGVKSKVRKSVADTTSSLFDTHPCAKDRILSAQQEQAAGVFQLAGPASDLFVHFEPLCKNITWDFYRDVTNVHIKPDQLLSIDELIPQIETSWPTR
jgi:Zn-dependent protease with chaperone function